MILSNAYGLLKFVIFLVSEGLESWLMPLQLPHSSENFVHLHRQMLNNHYNDAVKYLRLALYSATPLSAALLPLVQVNFVFLATFLWIRNTLNISWSI